MRFFSFILFLLMISCKNEIKSDIAITESKNVEQTALEVVDYEGLEKYLNTTSDKTYVVNFWATWCAPCIKELPYFEQLNASYADKKVEVILVSLDFPKKYDSNLKPYIVEKQLKSKVLALNDPDSNSWIKKISADWTGAIPATLIFNKDKRQFYEQTFTFEELETQVKQFLN